MLMKPKCVTTQMKALVNHILMVTCERVHFLAISKEKRKRKEKKRKENGGWYNSYLGNICQILVYQVHPGPLLSLVESLQERLGPALEVFDK